MSVPIFTRARWLLMVAGTAALWLSPPAHAQGGVFYEVEIVKHASPVSEYAKIAQMSHDFCNISRKQVNLPPKPFPTLPNPFVLERLWTLSNGTDYVLRKREPRLEPGGNDPEDCDVRLKWSETIVIMRGGKTTEITRASDGFNEVNREAFTSPWSLERNFDAYPQTVQVAGGLVLRCAQPGRDAPTVSLPILNATRLCIAQRPAVFRDAFGQSLLMEYDGNGEMFGGRGGKYQVTARVQRFGTRMPTAATWDPNTYLRD